MNRERVLLRDVRRGQRVRKAVARSFTQPEVRPPKKKKPQYAAWANGSTPDGAPATLMTQTASVLGPMPRRAQVRRHSGSTAALIPDARSDARRVGLLQTLRRFGVWLTAMNRYSFGTLVDRLRGRDSVERRAVRLRQSFEHAGGTLVKIGQQLSIRLDVLPARYCQELALMLDRVPPFPSEQAIAAIERTTGRKLEEIFSAFDPEPIGSASIACVYQAVLRENGARVAVKVRRPHVRETFEADFRVIDLLTKSAEWLTLVRPNYSANIRVEFRKTLSSELDFRREARFQTIFRRRTRWLKNRPFTAPRVYHQWSSDEVLVMEFISGMWLGEVLTAVEQHEPAALARMQALNLNPRRIARRLLYANSWGLLGNLAFHADPHPANIVVRANNELVFVDFGAFGYLNAPQRLMYARTFEAFLREDVWAMTQLALTAFEPLPPMDINAITQETQHAYQNQLLQIKSKQTPWYERTSANTWLASLSIMSKYKLPAPVDILMYARATLLYDTLAARLYPRIDYYKEYQKFAGDAAGQVRKLSRKAMRARRGRGLTGEDFAAFDRLASAGSGLLYRLQRLSVAPYDFTMVTFGIEKWVFVTMSVLRWTMQAATLTVMVVLLGIALQWLAGQAPDAWGALLWVAGNRVYQAALVVLALLHLRLILFRMRDMGRKV